MPLPPAKSEGRGGDVGGPRPRPTPGTVTRREISVKVCTHCRCVIDDTGLCDYSCDLDGEPRGPRDFFLAIYDRVDTFLRDEKPGTSNANPAPPQTTPEATNA